MSEKTYMYLGPPSGVTLPAAEVPKGKKVKKADRPKPREVLFHTGKLVSLPSDNDYVQRLEAQGLLVAQPDPVAAKDSSPAPSGEGNASAPSGASNTPAPSSDGNKTSKSNKRSS